MRGRHVGPRWEGWLAMGENSSSGFVCIDEFAQGDTGQYGILIRSMF